MGPLDKDLSSSDGLGIPVKDAEHLLEISRQAIDQDATLVRVSTARGSPLVRGPVVARHLALVRDLEEKLDRLRLAGRQQGVKPDAVLSAPLQSQTGAVDNDLLRRLLERLEALPELMTERVGQAAAQLEIDRLKAELRRANRLITILQQAVDTGRPQADLGLDELD